MEILLLLIILCVLTRHNCSKERGYGHQPNVPPRDWNTVKPPPIGSAMRKDK